MSENVQNTQAEIETPVDVQEGTEEVTTQTTESSEAAPRGERRPRGDRRENRGMRQEEKEFREELLAIDRVTRVTAGGRQLRFRASVVIGDGKGRIGLGIGKAGEVQVAIEKAVRDAKKNLITFPIVNGTIAHDVFVSYKSSSVFLHPASPGTGIIAGGSVRKIFAVSGLKDVIAKQHGAPNRITNARVAMKALASIKPLHLTTRFDKKSTQTETVVATESPAKKAAPKARAPKKSAE